MWSVWLYVPNDSSGRFLNRYHTRNEAEAYRSGFQRIIGARYQTVVCFDN